MVTRNGRSASTEKLISPRQIYNVLNCARTAFAWAKDVQVAKLPASFVNPFTVEIVGERPRKDPLRRQLFPCEQRTRLVANMDEWQLSHLALSLVLPLRPEDFAGLLVGDVDFETQRLAFGSRFAGRDFNKGHVNFVSPFPAALIPFLRFVIGGRTDGPLLRARTIFEGRRQPGRAVAAGATPPGTSTMHSGRRRRDLKTLQDQKRLVRAPSAKWAVYWMASSPRSFVACSGRTSYSQPADFTT